MRFAKIEHVGCALTSRLAAAATLPSADGRPAWAVHSADPTGRPATVELEVVHPGGAGPAPLAAADENGRPLAVQWTWERRPAPGAAGNDEEIGRAVAQLNHGPADLLLDEVSNPRLRGAHAR